MEYIKKQRKIIICAISIIIFIIILRSIMIKEMTAYDMEVYNILVKSLRNDVLTYIMKFFTFLCSVVVLAFICIFTLILYKDKTKASLISINLFINYLLNTCIKHIVQRPRPEGYRLIEEHGYSFPSGHAMISMAFYGYIVYLIYKNEKVIWKRNLFCFILLSIILFIGISRVYLGVHYASDVLAGFFLSIAYLMLFITFSPNIIKFIKERSKKWQKRRKQN